MIPAKPGCALWSANALSASSSVRAFRLARLWLVASCAVSKSSRSLRKPISACTSHQITALVAAAKNSVNPIDTGSIGRSGLSRLLSGSHP